MDYFFSHIGYVIVAAVVIAILGLIMVVVGGKNQRERDPSQERDVSCGLHCSQCKSFDKCTKISKRGE